MSEREKVPLVFVLTKGDALPVGLKPLHVQALFGCGVMNISAQHIGCYGLRPGQRC